MKHDIERRSFAVELREDGGKPVISGYAAVFNTLSCDLWGFREKIAPGAFKKTIQESDVRALWNHDTGIVLGRSKAGTLRLSEDTHGLAIEIDPPESASSMLETMRRGDVDQMSFGFEAIRDLWEEDREADTVTRTLLEVRLYEVSIVAFPAYDATSVGVRATERAKEIRSKFAVPSTKSITTPGLPMVHLADHRRMSLELALRAAQ
jgi:HK97 family phage prohead protease